MNHLTKEELEKLKVGDKLECEVILPSNINSSLSKTTSYFLKIIGIKLGRNGYRVRTHLSAALNTKTINIVELDRVFCFFTINDNFSKDGIHNPGKNYSKRKYYKLCQ